MGWEGPVTHRQFLAWIKWDEAQWHRPTVDHYYQAQIAMEVARVLSTQKGKFKLSKFILKFRTEEPKPVTDVDRISARMRARHMCLFPPGSIKVVYKPRPDPELVEFEDTDDNQEQ